MKFRNPSEALAGLSRMLKEEGVEREGRTGSVLEVGPVQFQIERPEFREILIPGRKASLAAQVAETMWVLAARKDVDWLSAYVPSAHNYSDDGETWRAAYGPRLKGQISRVVRELEKDQASRRAVASLWNPMSDLEKDWKDVPCNNWLHFFVRDGSLNLHVATRSNDLIWGWSGINQFEWSVLQELLAGRLRLSVGPATYSVSSLHVYERHFPMLDKLAHQWPVMTTAGRFSDQAARKRGPIMPESSFRDLDSLVNEWFRIEGMIRKQDPASYEAALFLQDRTMRSWLGVIADFWGAWGESEVQSVITRRQQKALEIGSDRRAASSRSTVFCSYVDGLHREKDAAYGSSWIRRGLTGVAANLCRKADRLGVTDNQETALDTAVDLLVYSLKLRTYLSGNESPDSVEMLLRNVAAVHPPDPGIPALRDTVERVWETVVDRGERPTPACVATLTDQAFGHAFAVWKQ